MGEPAKQLDVFVMPHKVEEGPGRGWGLSLSNLSFQ